MNGCFSIRAAIVSAALLLGGCGQTLVATVDPFCGDPPDAPLEDVCISKHDRLTEGTAQRIEANNLALRKLCRRESQCPKPTKS